MQFAGSRFYRLIALPAALALTLGLAVAASAEVFEDKFPGTKLNEAWLATTPVGTTIAVDNALKITVPVGTFDYWSTVGNAPRITLPAPAGDFTVSAKINSINDPTDAPLEGLNYHAVLVVNFGGTDDFMWGAYRGNTHLVLERSGTNSIAAADVTAAPFWVQIKKVGTTYHFLYREGDTGAYTEVVDTNGNPVTQTVATSPMSVGLMHKTWGDAASTATFGDFTLEASKIAFPGTLSGTVTTDGPSAAKLALRAVNELDGTTILGAIGADGKYSLSLNPATYTVSVVGTDLVNAGAATTTKSGVVIKPNGTVTANFTTQVLPDMDASTDEVFTDDFAGTTLKPQWVPTTSKAGATISVNNGLNFTVTDTTFDYWAGVSDAPRINMPAPKGDFTISAQVKGVLDGPGGAEVADQNFHTTLTVNFGGYDTLMWGLYRSNTHVAIERAGVGQYASANLASVPSWIQIKKVGDVYHFLYKQNEADAWTEVAGADGKPVTLQVLAMPQLVGLQHKTWAAVPSVATFGKFIAEARKLRNFGTLAGKVTTNGPSPATSGISSSDTSGSFGATYVAPIAADGTYSTLLGDGTYTVSVTGASVITPQPDATKTGVVVAAAKTTTQDFNVNLLAGLDPSKDEIFTDDFAGTTLKPEWLVSIPVAGPIIAANNGLKFTMPGNATFDAWAGVANAPGVRLPAPQGDFIETAKLGAATDPDGAPLSGQNYHSAITVNFGGADNIWWGAYRDNTVLQLERSGTGGIGTVSITALPVWVRMTRTVSGGGSIYSFAYRESDTGAWTDLVNTDGNKITISVVTPPVYVGVMQKTWANVGMIATWNHYELEASKLRYYGSITGAVSIATAVAPLTVQALDTSGAIVAKTAVDAAGTYGLRLVPGTYTVRVVDSSPGVAASKTGVVLDSKAAVTVDFGGTTPPPATNYGDLNGDGKVSITDVVTALRGVAGLVTLTDAQKLAADVNGDGKFNISDVVMMLRFVAGLITKFPVQG
ncbi:MAG TPA: dockerin type I domain-containing protein [Armatimonadota bacterium]